MSQANQTSQLERENLSRSRRFARRTSLGTKIPVAVLGLLLVSYILYAVISIWLAQQALIDTLSDELQEQANSQAAIIQADLLTARAVAQQLAILAESATLEEEGVLNILQNTLKKNDNVFGSTLAFEPYQFQSNLYYYSPYYNRTPEGGLAFTQLGTGEYDYFNRDWYELPRASQTPILSTPYFDYGGGNIWMTTWSIPFFAEDGSFKGVATADIAFSQTQALINAIEVGERQSGESGYAFLIDRAGIILGIGENGGDYEIMSDSMVLAAYSEKTEGWIGLVAEMRAGNKGFMEATDPNGIPMLVAYTPIGLDTGWSLALAYPKGDLATITSQLRNTVITYTLLVVFLFGILLFVFTRSITEPLQKLRQFASRVSQESLTGTTSQLAETVEIRTRDELEDLGDAFNQMAATLRQSFETLEGNVTSRTRDLERLAIELRTIAEVSRELAIIRDLNTLINVSANLIRERLGYYHVGIFLVDERGEYAILRGASSIAAEQLLSRNYKLKVGETGLVGNVTRSGQAYIALDVGLDAVHFENPFLPETRSEIALPLRSYNITIGALDIQATHPNAFDDRSIQTLQVLADQLAAAIENAQLVQRLEKTLEELSKTTRMQTRQVWQSSVEQRDLTAYEYDGLQIRPIPKNLSPELARQLEGGRPIQVQEKKASQNGSKTILYVPLMVLDQIIGVIGLEQEDASKSWTEEQITIAQAAANRAALTLENARLLEESHRRASKERTIFEATNRIGAAVSMENILQTTAEELERILSGSSEVTIQFTDNSSEQK
ncbi:MAG: GAF domain-containing protein [Anaerolineales bacterium]|nr:GAF domain-containing protein [Anaerolineales bacterium]